MLALSSCSQPPQSTASTTTAPQPNRVTSQPGWFSTTQAAETLRWPAGKAPIAMTSTNVIAFANDLHHPRWLYALPNGDILVAESNPQPANATFSLKQWISSKLMHEADEQAASLHQITLLRDKNGDGIADERYVFVKETALPVGVALVGDTFYIANTDTLLQFAYQAGQTQATPTVVAPPPEPDDNTQSLVPDKRAKQPIDMLAERLQQDGTTPQRPANVLHDKRGYLLVADDVGNVIWHVKGNRKVAQQ
jgi:glucose/arabinose dehydrogenase